MIKKMIEKRLLHLGFLVTVFLSGPLFAMQKESEAKVMWPGVDYDPNIPTFYEVLGYHAGDKISDLSSMHEYFDALQKAAPDRISVREYARSWEGRKLIYAVVASPENLMALEDIADNTQKLSDPRITSRSQATNIIDALPASVWLQFSVHGNEISGTDAAMMTAYHLLAAPNDPINRRILENTVVFIDPLQNPDGRSRFIANYYATAGMVHSGDRLSAEQNEPWPRGRTNHYLFDLNRDWLAITQPETKGKIAAISKYKPQVIVDVHEMGGDMSYYFAPAAKPFNPHMTETQIANMDAIGLNHAKHFDKFGFDYFTREIFDAFYPGYGDSWPTFYGASASTYEVGSARGERFTKRNGETFTYWDTVQRQFVASVSTAEGTAINREKILQDFYQYQVDAIEAGKKSQERVYILPNQENRGGTHHLATLMARHGVEVKQTTDGFKACGAEYQAGSYVIDTAQPRGNFVTTTFTDQVDMSEGFIKEQERRRARNLGDQIYDVTGWSLPMMFNVESVACDRAVRVDGGLVAADDSLSGNVTNPDASVAYIVPWGDITAVRFLTSALRAGISLKSADAAFVLDGKQRYPAGSLIIEHRANKGIDLAAEVSEIAKQTGALVEGVNTSWVTDGPSFGSGRTVTMNAPNIAMAWDTPTSSLSAGNTRFVIERQLGYPVTAIRTNMLGSADLSHYQVLILPEGSYDGALGKSGADNLKSWVREGGVLIALGRANRFVSHPDHGLLNVQREFAYRETKDTQDLTENKIEGELFEDKSDLTEAIIEPETSPDFIAGVLANIEVDQEHWLTAGVDKNLITVAYGSDIYTPIKLDSGKNLAWFTGKDEVLASGYLWEENKAQLAYKPVLIHQPMGKGMVIGYTQSPTFRAYLDGLNVLFANSIFRAAAHAQ